MTGSRGWKPDDPEYVAWQERLGPIGQAASAWQVRTAEAPAVDPGSSLAGDNLGGLNVSNLAWHKIVVGVEHLDFFSDVIRATGTLYPTAYLTVLRTALLSSSHAVWLLAAPTREERRVRALRLEADDLRSQVAMIQSPWALSADQEQIRATDLQRLRERQTGLATIASDLGVTEEIAKMRLDNTAIVTWASRHAHAERDQIVASGVQLLWRTGSAVAHAQRSHAVLRLHRNETVVTDDGARIMHMRGDLIHDVGPAAAAVAFALSEGFRLWDLRRVNHRTAGKAASR